MSSSSHQQQQANDISLADITAARNSKIAAETTETQRIASELEGAHQDALNLKEQLRQEQGDDAVPQQQAFPHGSILCSTPAMSSAEQHQQHGENDGKGMGERVAEGVANTDQTVTTAVRDAVHRASQGVSVAGNAAAEAAGSVADKAREAVKGTVGTKGAASNEGQDKGVSGYEGVVFSSDDPEYTKQDASSMHPAGASVTESRIPALTLDELREGRNNHQQQQQSRAKGNQPTIASPSEPTPKPAASGAFASLTNFLLTGSSSSHSRLSAASNSTSRPPHFIIATPTEPSAAPGPASYGEGRVGIAAGDPKGGANVMAAAHVASKGIVDTVKSAIPGGFGGSRGLAGAPIGPSDPDPRTANVHVGDFKALHEALHLNKDSGSSDSSGSSGGGSGGSNDGGSSGMSDRDNAATGVPSAQEMKEGWEGLKSQAQEGLEAASDSVQEGLDAASDKIKEATAGASDSAAAAGPDASASSVRGTGATGGGGLLGGLAGIVSSIATKVDLANSSEELMAGGTVPDAAAAPAAAAGPTGTSAAAPEVGAAADAAADAAAQARDAVTPDSSNDTVAAAKDAASDAAERVQQGAADVRDAAADKASAATESVNSAGQSVRETASDAAARVSNAAASAKDTVVETAVAAKDKAADTAQAAKDSVVDAAVSAKDKAADTAAAPRDTVTGAATAAKDKTADTAAAARDAVTGAAAAARDKAADTAAAAKQTAADAQASAAETAQSAADKAAQAAGGAKESAAGGLSSLIQGAKEGLVGAYDAAASVLVGGDDDKPQAAHTPSTPPPAAATGSDSSDTPAASKPPANVAGAGGRAGDELQSGAVGSGHAAAPTTGGLTAVLKQGWEDLKHGGAKAPHAVSTGGETSAPHDVTSNIERSKHLDDAQQAKIYKAETYAVAPGSQAASDQAATDSSNKAGGVVAGDKRPVTGTVPHDKPDTYRVHPDQGTRFEGDKGMSTGFGTGSAAPWDGDDSIKTITGLFGASGSSQQPRVESSSSTTVQAERAGSSVEGGVSSWVSSMSAAWRNLGVASAKGPIGKEAAKDIQWDNPTQDAVIDPVRGVTKKEGHSPGHKIQMRTNDQIPPDGDVTDPQLYKDKAERLGKVVSDTLTSSDQEAAADPNNLKGKSSDNKPDGLKHFLKHEAGTAADAASRAPEATASALGTAGEIVAGVAGHVVDKAKELGHNITQHGDFMSAEDRVAKSQAAVARVEQQMEAMGDLATDHNAVQELQEQRMAAIGDPAHKRETLGDKVIGPLVKDASDDTNARALAASYKEWKQDKEHGTEATQLPDAPYAPGTGPSSLGGGAGAGGSGSGGGSSSSTSVGDAVRGLGHEAGDTVQATHEVVKMEGQAAGEGVGAATDKASSKVGGAVDAAKGLAGEAADTARATGEVVSMEVSSAADAIKDKAGQAVDRTSDTAHDIKQSAQDTAQRAADTARDTKQSAAQERHHVGWRARHHGHKAEDTAQHTADTARDTAASAGDAVRDTANRAGDAAHDTAQRAKQSAQETADSAHDNARGAVDSVKDAAGRAGDSARELADAAGDKVQQGVDAVAEGSGYVVGAGAETASEAQDAAARAGQKAGAAAGGVLSSVGETAKGLLGALLGPFEREGAFDESTAVLTGPPKDFDPVGAEQLPAGGSDTTQAPAVTGIDPRAATAGAPTTSASDATTTTSTTSATRRSGAAAAAQAQAPAGSSADVVDVEGLKGRAAEVKEGLKAQLQAGVDDTAKAAGLTAGHIESAVEIAVEGAKQQIAAVQDKVAAVTEEIHVPPAELTTNTEDLLRQRQAQIQQQQQ